MSETWRSRLPNRRPSVTRRIEAAGIAAYATIGFNPATGVPSEIFMSPCDSPVGSSVEALISDLAVVISVALQHGVPPEALSWSVAYAYEGGRDGERCSIVGAALDAVVAEQRRDDD